LHKLGRIDECRAVSVTGICGPAGGSTFKPVGLAYFGLARKGAEVHAVRRIFSGDRVMVKERMALFALDLLRCRLLRH
ncbi:MAG: CinA family protein, partial [Elusimicrobiota bacterium]